MLERLAFGTLPRSAHTVLRGPAGELRYEHCLTRRGFDGPYTIAYHERRPHEAMPADAAPVHLQFERTSDARLLRRHYRSLAAPDRVRSLPRSRGALLTNEDVTVSIWLPRGGDAQYRVNADGDELWYVQRGAGTLRSLLGDVPFASGDYVYVPRGVLHRALFDDAAAEVLVVETAGPLGLPAVFRNPIGQLRLDAPYQHRDFVPPVFREPSDEGIRELVVQSERQLHAFVLPRSPLDVVGWDGTLYPFAFSIHRYKPRVGRVHLPPPVHATFEAPGVLVCSFVPRPLDFDPKAVPCPYPHSSVDIDEVLFCSAGSFGSRRGVAPGSVSYHPRGIPHGPHPGTYEGSLGRRETDELAVMLDCSARLSPTALAASLEDVDYHASFAG